MFTGIIESMGRVESIEKEGANVHFSLSCDFTEELKIDQSLAHNGVCLTVVAINNDIYTVTAIDETLKRTNLGAWRVGDHVNLERCMPMNGRLDGHIVQGHVDTMATCKNIKNLDGSWEFIFSYDTDDITVEKGSITVNGTSLTIVSSEEKCFSVHVIPYTFNNTVFKFMKEGDTVNIEFDIIGKYVAKLLNRKKEI
ncbi:MAG: riboflavin synthase [Crocinitomicaceae bacterium]|nr:riboflavin synthase [Crocinitomicaceae bacterium]